MTGFSPTWTVYEIVNKNELFLPMLQYSWGKLASVRKSPRCPMNTLVMTGYLIITYALSTKPKVKTTEFWPSSFLRFF